MPEFLAERPAVELWSHPRSITPQRLTPRARVYIHSSDRENNRLLQDQLEQQKKLVRLLED